MSTQFETGEGTLAYWAAIAAGEAAAPTLAQRITWAQNRSKGVAAALAAPPTIAPDVATITAASGNGTDVTVTALNNFKVGQLVRFAGLNNDLTALNGVAAAVLASGLSTTQFEVASTAGVFALTITAVSGNGTDVTFTAANTLVGGESVTFSGLGGEFAALNTGGPYTVIGTGLSGTQFEIASAVGGPQNLTITAVAGSGTVVTFTATNTLAAGDHVTFSGLAGGFTGFNSGGPYTVLAATGTNFTVTSTTTGATTTGTATTTSASTTGTASAAGVAATTGTATAASTLTPLPTVGLNSAAVVPAIFDFSPQRYVL